MKTMMAKAGMIMGLMAAAWLMAPGTSLAKQDCRAKKKSSHNSKKCVGKEVHQCKKVGKNWRWVKILTCNYGCKNGTGTQKGKAFCKCSANQNYNNLFCEGNNMYRCNAVEGNVNGGTKALKYACRHGCYKSGYNNGVYCACPGGRKKGETWCSGGKKYQCLQLSVKVSGDYYSPGSCR